MLQSCSGIWGLIKDGVVSAWTAIANFFTQTVPNLLVGLLDWFKALPGKILEFLLSLPEKIGALFGLIVGAGIKGASDFFTGVIEWFSKLPERLSNLASQAWEFVKTAFVQGVTFAIESAIKFHDGLVEWFTKLPGKIKEIFDNIFDFFSNLPSILWNKAKSLGESIWKGFLDGLDVHSPSGPEKAIIAMAKGMEITLAEAKPKLSQKAGELGQAIDSAISSYLDKIGIKAKLTVLELSKMPQEWKDRVQQVVRDSQKAADDLNKIGLTIAFFPEKAKEAFDKLLKASHDATIQIQNDLPKLANDELPIRTGNNILFAVEQFEKLKQAQQDLTKAIENENGRRIESEKQAALQIIAEQKKLYEDLEHIVGPGMAVVVKLFADGLGKTLAQANKFTDGFLQVIDNIPGKVGDKLRDTTNKFISFVNQIDQVLKGLHKIFNGIPDGIAGVLKTVEGLFSKTKTSATKSIADLGKSIFDTAKKGATATGEIANKSATDIGDKTSKAFGTATAAVGGFLTGLTTASATGSKAIGSLVGGIQGALQGFAAGEPIGAVIGGIGGILGGLFGGGKSEAQKQKEKLDLEKLKQDVAKGAQEVVQAAISSFQAAREFLESITFYSKVPKDAFAAFFKDLSKLMDRFIELAKAWGVDGLKKAEELSKIIGPVVESIANAPLALEQIGKYLGITESSITRFFADFSKVINLFGQLAEEIPKEIEKRVKKFAKRIDPVITVWVNAVGALVGMFEVKPISDITFTILRDSIKKIISSIGDLADDFEKFYLKQLAFFAEKASAGLEALG